MGDFNNWDSGPKHAAPQNVRDVYRREAALRQLRRRALLAALILAVAGAIVWYVISH